MGELLNLWHEITTFCQEIWLRVAWLFFWKRRGARYIVILGAPGAGKGTISTMLSARMNLPILSTGNLLRREIANGTAIGKKCEALVKSGQFVSDDIVLKLLRQELDKAEYFQGAIFDGYPRNLLQAQTLRKTLAWWGNKVNRVVLLDVEEKDLVERLSLRRICSNKVCGQTFHVNFKPPRAENRCDVCQSELTVREDDKPEVVKDRLHVFHETSGPLRRYYERSRLLTRVVADNTTGPEDVLQNVLFTIEQFD